MNSALADMTTWKQEYPFESNYFDAGVHRIHYLDESKTDAGNANPLLMVHGNPTWSFYWRKLINRFRRDHRVVAIDHLGCGLSDKPADYDYCLQAHIDNLGKLLKHLDLRNVTLVAHDWGGSIGLGGLLAHRDRFRRIVLFNTGAYPPPFIPFRIRVCRWPFIGKMGVQGLNLFARAAIKMATEQPGGLPKTVAEGLLYPYDSWNHRTAIYRFVKDIPLSPQHRTWAVLDEIERRLPEVADWPIVMIWGMRDWCFRPECLERFEKIWPQAKVHRVETAGHYVVEDAAVEIEQWMADFLTTT